MKKLTLILPDIHHKVDRADKIIQHVGADEVICLGDAFDDFDDTPEMVSHTAEWFVDFVNKPNHIFIGGNHDWHYAYDIPHLRCSGYEQWKSFIINDVVSKRDWEKMKFYHFLDGKWLLSHGGLHKFHLPKKIAELHADRPKFMNELEAYLTEESYKAFREDSWFLHAGHSRGGIQRVGGLTWCDHNQEMYPIIGLHQIYGHSPQQAGSASWLIQDSENSQPYFELSNGWSPSNTQLNTTKTSYNLCLDVWKNMHYATWDGLRLLIYKFNDI